MHRRVQFLVPAVSERRACNFGKAPDREYVQRQRAGGSLVDSLPPFCPNPSKNQGEKEGKDIRETYATNKKPVFLARLQVYTVSRSRRMLREAPTLRCDEDGRDGSPSVVVAARRRREEGRHVAAAGEPDVVGGRVRRRLVVAEGRLPAAGEVEDGAVQERQQALHPFLVVDDDRSLSRRAAALKSAVWSGATAEEDKEGF
jgi:hypothetical protein